MTSEVAARLRAGRERAIRERMRREDDQLGEFRAWLTLERETYQGLLHARETFGELSAEAAIADAEWHHALALSPGMPTDAAFERERERTPIFVEVNHV